MTHPTPEKVYRAYLEAVIQTVGTASQRNYRGKPVRTRDHSLLRGCYTQFWTGPATRYCHALLPPDCHRNPGPDYTYREIDTTTPTSQRLGHGTVVATGAQAFTRFDRGCVEILPQRPELWLLIQEVLP